jgi:hypothetical protein
MWRDWLEYVLFSLDDVTIDFKVSQLATQHVLLDPSVRNKTTIILSVCKFQGL